MKKTNSGRSMVELIAILSVMGILAVSGVIMFERALNKNKAIELINVIKTHAFNCSFQIENPETTECDLNKSDYLPTYALTGAFVSDRRTGKDTVEIAAKSIPTKVCKELIRLNWNLPISIYKSKAQDTEEEDEIKPEQRIETVEDCETDTNSLDMYFAFNPFLS